LRDEEDADAQESEITQLLQLGAEDFAVRWVRSGGRRQGALLFAEFDPDITVRWFDFWSWWHLISRPSLKQEGSSFGEAVYVSVGRREANCGIWGSDQQFLLWTFSRSG
jgi:hypothetical protein